MSMDKMLARDKKMILIRVSPETRKSIRFLAVEKDTSISKLVEKIIEEYLEKSA